MDEFMIREELNAIHEHAECDFPFDEAEEDARKLLRYVDFLENMPIVQIVVNQNALISRLSEALSEIAKAEIPLHGSPDSWAISIARQALEGANS